MRALLLKDFQLFKQQKIFILLILAIGIFLSMTSIMDTSFILCYMTFVSSIFVVSSISYDEDKDGYLFLFTLPVTRKDYVKGKYWFGFLVSLCFWLIAVTWVLVTQFMKGASFVYVNYFALCFIILCLSMILTSILIPVQMKFGKSSGEITMVFIAGVAFAIAITCVRYTAYIPTSVTAIVQLVERMGFLGVSGCLFIVMLLVFQLSYHCSLNMMRKKEL